MEIKDQARNWLKEPPPDNGEPEPAEIAEAREIILGLLNLCHENDESFNAAIKNIDRKYARIQILGKAIHEAVRRIEEVDRRDGGPDWRRAKDLLKSDMNLILGGLQAVSAESI